MNGNWGGNGGGFKEEARKSGPKSRLCEKKQVTCIAVLFLHVGSVATVVFE